MPDELDDLMPADLAAVLAGPDPRLAQVRLLLERYMAYLKSTTGFLDAHRRSIRQQSYGRMTRAQREQLARVTDRALTESQNLIKTIELALAPSGSDAVN